MRNKIFNFQFSIFNSRGYTLIEVLAAVAIFFIVVASPTGFFVVSLKNQIKTLALREIIDTTSYTLEYVSRALRMARKDLDGSCIEANLNYKNTTSRVLGNLTYSGPGIKFKSYKDPAVCQEFFLDENDHRLKESKNGGSPISLTSDDLEIKSLKFQLSGQEQEDDLQPKVTILFEIEKKNGGESKIRLQTTISQRNLDVIY